MDRARAMPSLWRRPPRILCLILSRLLAVRSVTLAVAIGILVSARTAGAQTHLDVLHAFSGGTDGAEPAALIQATDGNFYGTTYHGGGTGCSGGGCGTVFRMTPSGTVTVLHAFIGGADGENPASLIQATDGSFYGTTYNGGGTGCSGGGCGTVFRMSPSGTVSRLHAFNGTDGASPSAALIQATDGNFYGTSAYGGGFGTVFKMTPSGTVTILHTFTGGDGYYPSSLIQATDGNFYGTTIRGGPCCINSCSYTCGTVFKMSPSGTVTILHAFTNWTDGAFPVALMQATDGNFYGTSAAGSFSSGDGAAFEMTPSGTLTVLHVFTGGTDGNYPSGPLIQTTDGNFYGTTYYGGGVTRCYSGETCGTVFKMRPSGTVTILHAFANGTDGFGPAASLIQATDGTFYGTTSGGGAFGWGGVFRLGPTTVTPAGTTLVSPSGTVSTDVPTYTWNTVIDAAYYYFWVSNSSGTPVIQTWYDESVCGATTCSVSPSVSLTGGPYAWWVRTWNSVGNGPWSSSLSFAVTPAATTLLSPSGAISTNNPTYMWSAVTGANAATWYYLWVQNSSGTPVITQWYDASVCEATTCSVTPSTALAGTYNWWVQTWNTAGNGPWSKSLSFTGGVPPATTLISPTGSISTQTPTYTWTKVSSASWYYLWVENHGGTPPVIQTWYTAASLCSTSTCSVTPAVTLAAGNMHTWWVETYDGLGYGPWSSSLSFTPNAILP
jgi:uncharacterized repeat protein (TIGR03803 family)